MRCLTTGPRRAGRRPSSLPLVVEGLERRALLVTFTVNSLNDSGPGSLRQAILDANATTALDTIAFSIGTGPVTIAPASPLPEVTNPIIIDGTTQPGFDAGTNRPIVELSGVNAGSNARGLVLSGGGSTVKGLVINRFNQGQIELRTNGNNTVVGNYIGTNALGIGGFTVNAFGPGILINQTSDNLIGGTTPANRNVISGNGGGGIRIDGGLNGNAASRNVISGNYIGTDATGLLPLSGPSGQALGNGALGDGISISSGASNTIGGTAAGAGNVISGNLANGIDFGLGPVPGNRVEGNIIGLDALGDAAIPNASNAGAAGISIFASVAQGSNLFIGGTQAGARNIISGNAGPGISTFGSPTYTLIQGNFIGTDITGTKNRGNNGGGVILFSNNNTVGGTQAGAGNVIAYNRTNSLGQGPGIGVVQNSDRNTFLGNSIFLNGGLGIDLGNNGVTANDAGDADTGANTLLNFPVLTSAVAGSARTVVSGTYSSAPSRAYRLEFFASDVADPSDFGEGRMFLGATTVTTDTSGAATFSVPLGLAAAAGQVVTATATDPAGNTSEFSSAQAVAVAPVTNLVLTKVGAPEPVKTGRDVTYTITVANNGPATATGVVLTDTLPAGLAFKSASSTRNATFSESNGVVTGLLGDLAGGQTEVVTLVVTALAAGSYTDTATVSGNETLPSPANNTATFTTTVVDPVASLGLTMTDAPDPVLVGEPLTYTITVTNGGPDEATGVTVVDTLPAGVTFNSAFPSQGTFSRSGNVLTFNLGTLAPNASATLTISVTPTGPGTITNSAVATAAASPQATASESTLVNASTLLTNADLRVTQTASPNPVMLGDSVIYTITVTNDGPATATGVVLRNVLPAGATFVSARDAQGNACPPPVAGTLSCPLGDLPAGASVTLTVVITPGSAGPVSNQVTILATSPDPVEANNTSTEVVQVQGEGPPPTSQGADLALRIVATPEPVVVGGDLTYILTVTNAGPGRATGVVLRDVLPAGVTNVRPSVSQGTVAAAGDTVLALLGDLDPGGQATLTIVVTPTVAGPLTTSASVSATEFDPNPANGAASAVTTAVAAPGGGPIGSVPILPIFVPPLPPGPTVIGLDLAGFRRQPTAIQIAFSGPVDSFRARIAANYQIRTAGRDGLFGTRDDRVLPVRRAEYDAVTRTVTLLPARNVNLRNALISVNGTHPQGLTDPAGHFLDGDGNGVAGGDFVAALNRPFGVVAAPRPNVIQGRRGAVPRGPRARRFPARIGRGAIVAIPPFVLRNRAGRQG